MYFVALRLGLTEEVKRGGAADADKGEEHGTKRDTRSEQVAVVVVID